MYFVLCADAGANFETCCPADAKMRAPVCECVSTRVHRPHKMTLMLTWLCSSGLEGTKGHGIL